MADNGYITSNLLAFQGRVMAGLAEHEMRELDTNVLQYALKNQEFIMGVPQIEAIKNSTVRPVYGYQFNRMSTTGGTGMTTFPTGPGGSTAQIPLTFVTFSETFQTFNVSGLDNVMQFAQIFDMLAMQAMRNIRTRVREWLTTNLYTNRTTYGLPGLKNATFNALNDAFEIGGTNPYSAMTSVMRQNSYGDKTYDAFFDPTLYPQYQFTSAQGTMNATNLNYQFAKTPTAPGAGYFNNIWEDLNLGTSVAIEPAYTLGTALIMPPKSFAMVPWMPEPYYGKGYSKSFDQYVGGYGTIGDDKYREITYQIFGWNNQSDTTATNGYAQSQTQNWQIGLTLAFVTAFLSNTGETPIYQFALVP